MIIGNPINTTLSGLFDKIIGKKIKGNIQQLFFTKEGAFLKPKKANIQPIVKALTTEFILCGKNSCINSANPSL